MTLSALVSSGFSALKARLHPAREYFEKGNSEMLKKYYIKYRVKSLPTYWEFTCYVNSEKEALSASILAAIALADDVIASGYTSA